MKWSALYRLPQSTDFFEAEQDARIETIPVEVSVLLTNLGHCYPHVRRSAAEAPGKIGGEIAIPALMNALNNDQDSDVREKAVEALGEISSETAISALLEALEDKDPQVRLAVSEAIASIDSKVTALSLPNQQEE